VRRLQTELDLNNAQKTACARSAGAARYAYNWDWLAKEAFATGTPALAGGARKNAIRY